MTPYIVIMSDHKRPRYYVGRKMIGAGNYAVICTALSEYNARAIADAMSAATLIEERKVVPIKTRKRA